VRFACPPGIPGAQALLGNILSQPAAPGPRRIEGPFALYGAGKLGRMAMDFFAHIGVEPNLVVDANADALRSSPYWDGCLLLAPAEVPAEIKRSIPLLVSVATLCFTDLARTLEEQGWRDIVPIYDITEAYRDRYPLANGWFMGDVDDAGQAAIRQVLTAWNDDVSRAHHLQFMAWHRLRQDWVFDGAPVDLDRRYFIPEVVSLLGEHEVFVDVGAHTGEIAEAFRRAVGDRFEEILMFEPDPRNAATVEEVLSVLPESLRIKHRLLRCALSSRGGKHDFFAGLGYASQLSRLGSNIAEVNTLDAMDVAPSYIKMHLEGHELDALQGAEATLQRCRPMVAVTIYHSDYGLWKLPSWLMQTLTNYRFYLRLHSWCGTGAVMYCVPVERQRAQPGAKLNQAGVRDEG